MALDSKHPAYLEMLPDWQKMRHTYAGERAVKEEGQLYLPATSGMLLDGMEPSQKGYAAYQAYKIRAVFPNYVSEGVKAMVGVMHSMPASIELPPALEPLREKGSINGESLQMVLRRINEAQLTTGRIGLLLDLPTSPRSGLALPYIATYEAERITNWDNGQVDDPTLQSLNFVALNESEHERVDQFEWRFINKYRILILGGLMEEEEMAVYRQGLFDATLEFNEGALIEPQIRGIPLEQVPFVFINSTDLLSDPLAPPLLELANLCLTIYRGEADYRQSLFMQAQDTLLLIGAEKDTQVRIGAGAAILVPQGGDGKFIGTNSAGIPEQRTALENDRKRADQIGGQLLDTTSRAKESGEALKIRVAAQTATLNQVALAGAEGLQTILRIAAQWVGADPEAVKVTPNTEFADAGLSPADVLALAQAKGQGAPLSDESFHNLLKDNEYTILDWVEEQKLLDQAPSLKNIMLKRAQLGLQNDQNANDPAAIRNRLLDATRGASQ